MNVVAIQSQYVPIRRPILIVMFGSGSQTSSYTWALPRTVDDQLSQQLGRLRLDLQETQSRSWVEPTVKPFNYPHPSYEGFLRNNTYGCNDDAYYCGGGGGAGGGGWSTYSEINATPSSDRGSGAQNIQHTEELAHEAATEVQHSLVSSASGLSARTEPGAVLGSHATSQRTEEELETQNVHEDGEATNSTNLWPMVHRNMEALFCIHWYLDPLSLTQSSTGDMYVVLRELSNTFRLYCRQTSIW